MPSNPNEITIPEQKVNLDDLGVLQRHEVRNALDQEYHDAFLTPPGGKAPGEGNKPADPVSGEVPPIVVATAAHS